MHYCLGTDSIHTTAAACDYLERRVTDGDTVTVISVLDPEASSDRRDCEEALNVASVRLFEADVETQVPEGKPARELLEAIATADADELIIGARSGKPGTSRGVGSTTEAILTESPIPVVVVPLEEL